MGGEKRGGMLLPAVPSVRYWWENIRSMTSDVNKDMQGQGPSLQGQGLDLQGQGQGLHLQLLTASCS